MAAAIAADELLARYWEPGALGPSAQADLSGWAGLSAGGPPGATIPNGGNYTSGVIACPGFKALAVGVKLSQTGSITIQRYIDKAGTVPIGAAITAALVANTSNWATVNDGLPFQSFTFVIANTSGSVGNVSNFGCLVQSS
jgi:hypothetical protein